MGLSSKQVSADIALDWSQIGDLDIIPKPTSTDVEAEKNRNQQQQQKRPLLKCPRCDSANTKFCYYNNHSRLQPRHFCRTCKRHWTAGGTLRNVPVGGSRKNKRARTGHKNNNNANSSDQQQQQQQVAVPFSTGEIASAIFPDIFQQVMFQPQPQPPPLPTETLFSAGYNSSNSSSSPYGFEGKELVSSNEESMLSLMEGWLQPAASYWNRWYGMMEFGA